MIDSLLTKQADEAQTLAWVREAIVATNAKTAKEFGKVMGTLMKAHKEDVNGDLAKTLINRELGG